MFGNEASQVSGRGVHKIPELRSMYSVHSDQAIAHRPRETMRDRKTFANLYQCRLLSSILFLTANSVGIDNNIKMTYPK